MAGMNHTLANQHDYLTYFGRQTDFLTGGTGGLGGCLLYKLIVTLKVRKVFILCRGPEAREVATWNRNMPNEAHDLLAANKIVFITGDMTAIEYGIDPMIQAIMAEEVTILIHAAANISLGEPLSEIVAHNCLPLLELVRMSSYFKNLKLFIQISSAYANSHLSDGPVDERVYPLEDPEKELKEILTTDSTEHLPYFAWPLLTSQYPDLPLLIVRPTIVGPAIYEPHPFYGPDGSCPLESMFTLYIKYPGNGIWRATQDHESTTNILDEIPVDWVANIVLLYAAAGTQGIIHAGAASYVLRNFDQMLQQVRINVPEEVGRMLPLFKFVRDRSIRQCPLVELFQVAARDWRFDSEASTSLQSVKGPLGIFVGDHDVAKFTGKRFERFVRKINMQRTKPESRISKFKNVS